MFELGGSVGRVAGVALASAGVIFALGCGVSPSNPPATTHTMVAISSTDNAAINIFELNIQSISLLSADGKEYPIVDSPHAVELVSLNGVAHPLETHDIPQGTYPKIKLIYQRSGFVVIDHSDGDPSTWGDIGNYNVPSNGVAPVTAEVPLVSPVTISGNSTELLLTFDIPQATTYEPYFNGTSTLQPGGGTANFVPVIIAKAITPAAKPATLVDGMLEGVRGQVSANTTGLLTITQHDGSSLNFITNTSTLYAGVGGSTPSAAGTYVDVDAALQADGTMLATRVQTESTNEAFNQVGQVEQYTLNQYIVSTGREQQGPNLPNGTGFYGQNNIQTVPSTSYQIAWPKGAVPAGLPFTPAFNATSITVGQNLATPIPALQSLGNVIPQGQEVTLEPQTVDVTVVSQTTVNGQQVFSVDLDNADLPSLFGLGRQVVVYVTAETQIVSGVDLSTAVNHGMRVRGLLFDDGGTLRMLASTVIIGGAPV